MKEPKELQDKINDMRLMLQHAESECMKENADLEILQDAFDRVMQISMNLSSETFGMKMDKYTREIKSYKSEIPEMVKLLGVEK